MKRLLRAVVVMTALGTLPSRVSAQADSAAAPPPNPYGRHAVSAHPHGTAVAVALRLSAGSQDDQEGFEGTAWLLARVLEDEATRALEPSDAVLRASVGRASTVFTLLALPDEWRGAWEKMDSVLFDAPVDSAFLAARKAELLDNLRFERGSPVREFEREAARSLAPPGSPFTRPPRGTEESVANVSVLSLELYRRSMYRRASAVEAVVGPVPEETQVPPVDSAPQVPDTTAPDTPSSPEAPGPDTTATLAWSTGDRVVQVSDVTSTWMSVAYPAPTSLSRTRLELVAHLLEEELDPTPPDPDRYGVDVRIEGTPDGPVLVLEATVFPEAADRWEARILGAVTRLRDEDMGEDFFSWRRRRFRTARLLEEAAPEQEATRMTADLLRTGRVRDLASEIWGLHARTLREAARSLGEPRIFRLGPDLAQNGSGASGTKGDAR